MYTTSTLYTFASLYHNFGSYRNIIEIVNNLQIQTLPTWVLGQVKHANEIGNDECGLILFWYERRSLNTWHRSKCNWSKCLLIYFRKAFLFYKELETYWCEFLYKMNYVKFLWTHSLVYNNNFCNCKYYTHLKCQCLGIF